MTAQQLKNSILQMAVQGKLVPQNPDDEPASVLLERIKAEKEELIKAGKIKKDKKSSEIFRGTSRNLPYAYCEQIGKEIRDISDEVPFEIPDSWEWCRLGKIVYNRGQMKPESDFCYIDIGSIDNKKQKLSDSENIVTADKAPSRARKIIDIGDIIYSTVRPYLHNMCIIDRHFSLQPIASTGFAAMTCCSDMFNKYLFYYLLAPDFDNYANDTENSKGVAYPAINDDRLYKALIPVPPLNEQKRIVSKIEELLPYIEAYEKAETQLTALNTSFPDMLKKSILQYAVQGKLVPQNADDEPAIHFIEESRKEQAELIKRKIIKKEKFDSEIISDNEIPNGWYKIKLGEITRVVTKQTGFDYSQHIKPNLLEYSSNNTIPMVQTKNFKGMTFDMNTDYHIPVEIADKFPKILLSNKCLLLSIVGASIGNVGIYDMNIKAMIGGAICKVDLINEQLYEYLYYYLISPKGQEEIKKNLKSTAQGTITVQDVREVIIDFPPLAEQQRIVERIEELMPIIDEINK